MVNGRQESEPILWVLTIFCVSTLLRLAVDFKEAPSSLSESDDKVGRTWNSQICLQHQLQQQQWMRYLITILSHHLFSLHFLLPVICLASALHVLSANIWRLQNVCVCVVSRKCQENRKQTTFFGGFLGWTALHFNHNGSVSSAPCQAFRVKRPRPCFWSQYIRVFCYVALDTERMTRNTQHGRGRWTLDHNEKS